MRPNVFIRRYKNKKNKVHYYLIVRIPGKRDECRTLGNVSRLFVEEQRRKLLQQIYAGAYRPVFKEALPLNEFVDKFINEFAQGARSKKTCIWYQDRLKPMVIHLGDYPINQISQQILEKVIYGMEVSNRTKNMTLSVLRLLFQKAKDWDYIDSSPTDGIKWLKEEKGGSRSLTYAEISGLWNQLHAWQRSVIRVLVFSGLRTGELSNLKFQDINWEENYLTVVSEKTRKTKSRRSRKIPLNPDLCEELQYLQEWLPVRRGHCQVEAKPREAHQREYVFCHEDGSPIKSFRKTVGTAFKKAEIQGVTVHGLRKTFCSLLAKSGVHVKVAQELMGHRDPSLTLAIYTQVEDSQLREAVNQMPSMHEMKKSRFHVVQGAKK